MAEKLATLSFSDGSPSVDFPVLGGTVGPYYVGYMKDLTGNFAGGLYGLALLSLIAALVCAFFLHIPDHAAEAEATAAGARA